MGKTANIRFFAGGSTIAFPLAALLVPTNQDLPLAGMSICLGKSFDTSSPNIIHLITPNLKGIYTFDNKKNNN